MTFSYFKSIGLFIIAGILTYSFSIISGIALSLNKGIVNKLSIICDAHDTKSLFGTCPMLGLLVMAPLMFGVANVIIFKICMSLRVEDENNGHDSANGTSDEHETLKTHETRETHETHETHDDMIQLSEYPYNNNVGHMQNPPYTGHSNGFAQLFQIPMHSIFHLQDMQNIYIPTHIPVYTHEHHTV